MIKTLSKRQVKMLSYIICAPSYVSFSDLSMRFGISERTARNDLAMIDTYLIGSGVQVERKSKYGLRIMGSQEAVSRVLADADDPQNFLDKDTRISFEIILLLTRCQTSYEQLSEDCYVSRQTVINDVKQIRQNISVFNISVIGSSGLGLFAKGKESSIRSAIKDAMTVIHDDAIFSELCKCLDLHEFVQEAENILSQFEEQLKVQYADRTQLTLLLSIYLKRIRTGHNIVSSEMNYKNHINNIQENELWLTLLDHSGSKEEARFLYEVFSTARLAKISVTPVKDQNALKLATYLYDHLQKLQTLDPSKKDRFLSGLTQHLQSALQRQKNGTHIENELQDQIMISIPLIYEFTKEQLNLWEKTSHIEFDSSEIAYIAMYIASAYESSIQQETSLTVLLTCTFGITTSAILKSRIFVAIPECHVIGPLTMEDAIKYLDNHAVDLIISTSTFTYKKIPVIVVNPLLYQNDIEGIKNQLSQLSYSKMCNHFVNSYEKISSMDNKKPDFVSSKIADFVAEHNIQILSSVDSWEEAIQIAAKPLLAENYVEQRYVNRMIAAVKQFGTYMCLVEDVAFVHAGTEDGIKENCCAILALNKPVIFGDRNSKLVKYIVIIGIREKGEDSFLKLVYIFANIKNRKILKKENITVHEIESLGD